MKLYKDMYDVRFFVFDYEYDELTERIVDVEHTHNKSVAKELDNAKHIQLLRDLEYQPYVKQYIKEY